MHVAYLSSRAALALLVLWSVPAAATTGSCPGKADALGVSRVIEIDASRGPRYGTQHYAATLPLRPKEVVLTFDDGPDPKHTPAVLEALDSQCVKATFFAVGRQVDAYPELAREVVARGHTLANHTWSHPIHLSHLGLAQAKEEIVRGFASLNAAAPGAVAPFFRYPGLVDSPALNHFLARSRIAVFSCDVGSDDWKDITAGEIVARTLHRLDRTGGGIILFHDSRYESAAALELLLDALKARGYRVVHIVPKPDAHRRARRVPQTLGPDG